MSDDVNEDVNEDESEEDVDTIINQNYIMYLNQKEQNRRLKMLQRTNLKKNQNSMNQNTHHVHHQSRAST